MQTLTAPSLPGTPASPAEEQMVAKLERIDALYRLTGLARNSIFIERDYLTADLQEVCDELLWNDGDGSLVLADAAEQAAIELPLEIEYEGTWSAGNQPQADRVIITLCIGGPTCRIQIELDNHDQPLLNESLCRFYWGGTDVGAFFVPAEYHDAVRWFSQLVAC